MRNFTNYISTKIRFFLLLLIVLLFLFNQCSSSASGQTVVAKDVQCYYCMSPLSNVKEKDGVSKKIGHSFKDNLEGNKLPPVTDECDNSKISPNNSLLIKRFCPSQYCFKFSLYDKDSSPFTIRLCADDFKIKSEHLYVHCNKTVVKWETTICFCKGHLCNKSNNIVHSIYFLFYVIFGYLVSKSIC